MTSDMASVILVAALFVALIGVAVYIVFLLTLQSTLERCAPQNRTVSPGQVWLSLIPLFNIVWQFILVSRIAESLRREFAARQATQFATGEDYGKGLGTAMCALSLSSIIPFVGILTGLAGTICWIVYWVRISGYSRALESPIPDFAGAGASPGWALPGPEPPEPAPDTGWPILAVLLLGYGATYLQRIDLSLAMPFLQRELALSNVQTGWVFSAFVLGLIAGYVLITIITALGGTRWGVFVSLAGATLAASATGLVQNLAGLIIVRALLGVFVAGLLPAAVQAAREWFPSRIRPFAIGLVLASGQLVAAVAPPLFGWLLGAGRMGWRTPLLLSGVPTAIAAALCIMLWPARTPREPSRWVSGAAIASAVMLAVGLMLTAPAGFFLSTWLPYHANRTWGIGFAGARMASVVSPAAGMCGALAAGAIAWAMMSKGAGASRTRAVLLTVCGAMLPLVAIAGFISRWPFVLLLMGVGSLAYAGWSTLLYSAVAETLPARGVAIGAAIGALMASLSAMLVPMAWGRLVAAEGDQLFSLGVAATAALALLVVALLAWLVRQEPETAG
jgi:MFS family permease